LIPFLPEVIEMFLAFSQLLVAHRLKCWRHRAPEDVSPGHLRTSQQDSRGRICSTRKNR